MNINIAIILSGGEGKRFDKKKPKQFFKIQNKTIIELTIEKIINSGYFKNIILVSNRKYIDETRAIINHRLVKIIKGGDTRQESVLNGLNECLKLNPKNVIIHDIVRPLFSIKLIEKILENLRKKDCVIPAINAKDSIRIYNKNKYEDISRKNLQLIQTPQGFNFKKIFKAHKKYKNYELSDDSIVFHKDGNNISLIKGEVENFKITDKDDIKLAKILMSKDKNPEIRVGNGFDVHAFKNGKYLTLLGIKIPFNKSLKGHSDADVGFHTIVDAILGALSYGDIGEHFPPSEKKWKNKNSVFFMNFARDLLERQKFKINNLDVTLICEKPKIVDFKKKMVSNVAKVLKVSKQNVNVKATTTEKLGFTGREEGIACQASVTISKINEF